MREHGSISIVAFTGHRTYVANAEQRLRSTIEELYLRGARTFRVGMAEGFDLAAGMALVELKFKYTDICIEAVVPWLKFARRFGMAAREHYNTILNRATRVCYISMEYFPGVYYQRNDLLIDGADVVVAWYSGKSGGTQYTLRQAKLNGAEIINLHNTDR